MNSPQFWLGLTTGLLAAALLVLMVALLPFLQQLQRTATAAERLLALLERELPPILGNVRETTGEIKEVSAELDGGLKRVNQAADSVGSGVSLVQQQAGSLSRNARSLWVGFSTAWQVFTRK
ncbi:DUF948 domain-containing protein [Candidatus Cyanaurora vandensis]|uniref:DUF948 domain-containing protein n=1 Tax=Candidatus Cyanaurora vandensis TaxID=2714958 RepID=UPI0025811855|nr:DUF948 domain-containing protein [Candidatus Cyanaurora vandensis]